MCQNCKEMYERVEVVERNTDVPIPSATVLCELSVSLKGNLEKKLV